MNERGISFNVFLLIHLARCQKFTIKLKTMESAKPITMISDARPGSTGCRTRRIIMARRKQTLQIKADRLSILSKPMIQKPNI